MAAMNLVSDVIRRVTTLYRREHKERSINNWPRFEYCKRPKTQEGALPSNAPCPMHHRGHVNLHMSASAREVARNPMRS